MKQMLSLFPHRVGGNRKRYQQSPNVDKKSIDTVFSIAICRQCGDKCQSKTLFLSIFYLRSSIVLEFRLLPTQCDFLGVSFRVILWVLGKLCVVIQAMCIDGEVATHICIQGNNIILLAAEIPPMM